MKITILCSDQNHPINSSLKKWASYQSGVHQIEICHSKKQITGGDILFLVSCSEIVNSQDRAAYRVALVLHASDLPRGRGWSPYVWEIVNGAEEITVSLVEAEDKVDSGRVWKKLKFNVSKDALYNEINELLFEAEIRLMDFAINNFSNVKPQVQPPSTEGGSYRKRTPEDSRIDPEKSISSQFNLIRISDPLRYPTFFDYLDHRYILRIEKQIDEYHSSVIKNKELDVVAMKNSVQVHSIPFSTVFQTKSPVLIVAAHPDDDVLGCGGTIAKFADNGVPVHVVFLSDGVFSRDDGATSKALEARRAAAKKACEILGVSTVSFGDFPDNRMDTVPILEITKTVENYVQGLNPGAIFTHHGGDVNVDHRLTLEAVTCACRPQVGCSVKSILSFEVPSSTEWQLPGVAPVFAPNWFVDISHTFERKMAALNVYAAELRDWPHPRSCQGVEHLARFRGATVGVDAAEAFVLGRHIA